MAYWWVRVFRDQLLTYRTGQGQLRGPLWDASIPAEPDCIFIVLKIQGFGSVFTYANWLLPELNLCSSPDGDYRVEDKGRKLCHVSFEYEVKNIRYIQQYKAFKEDWFQSNSRVSLYSQKEKEYSWYLRD
ncbi:hypothetical protein UY3_05415 [Chelonia mydas]|uniref:Uncharacterized protein n=1 Tax=Chelonia mydas TaxID=8469 RepID=M7C9S0_CHEMY|nr:hypothetical protein UY3_05415 [Chelonia mydas]